MSQTKKHLGDSNPLDTTTNPQSIPKSKLSNKKVEFKQKDLPGYTLNEVMQHCTNSDAWTVVNDKVYDLSDFANSHPGGPM